MKALYCLDGTITVVDAARVETHLDEEKFEGAQNKSVDQLTFVNRVILNRVTLLGGNLKTEGCRSFCGGRRSILAVSSGTGSFGPFFPQNYVVACDPRCKWRVRGDLRSGETRVRPVSCACIHLRGLKRCPGCVRLHGGRFAIVRTCRPACVGMLQLLRSSDC